MVRSGIPLREKYSTISIVKPLLLKLLKVSDSDSPINVRIKEAVSFDLNTLWDYIHQLLNVVTHLDPQYKNLPYLNEKEKCYEKLNQCW